MAFLSRQYVSPAALTAAGVDLVGLTADQIRDLITDAGAFIEAVTDQVFNPIPEIRTWDGRGRPLVCDPHLHRLIAVSAVTVDYARTNYHREPLAALIYEEGVTDAQYYALLGATALDVSDYVVHPRYIELIFTRMPGGVRNVSVTGVFGWLEPEKAEVSTTLTVQVASAAVTATVASVTGFELGDVVLIGTSLYVIVTSIDVGNLRLGFDSIGTLPATLPVATTVRTWGRVPRPIANACTYLVHQFREEDVARADAQRFVDAARIKKEQTDRYMYELFPAGETSAGSLTGSIRHDMALRRYSRPGTALMV